jgi:arylsulfatase A-like enzyme/Tfp pilus assembly protein PilF
VRRLVLVPLIITAAAVLALAAVLATRYFGKEARTAGLRNVLLITMDTTRADYLGCFGRTTARTPNIERLAREGTAFTHCTTCAPLTLPSHASIMTGVYPYVHGARQNGTGRLADSNVTLAETLKAAGMATQATVASFVLNRQFGIAQGFDVYHDVARPATGDPSNAERRGDEVADDALAMLRSLAGQRFFLWVHFYDPHFPYHSTRTTDVLSPLAYADEIAFMDTQIGRLLAALRELNLERSTLVVAVADHGEGLNDHDEWKHGYFLYETTLHTPLIFRCPGVVPAGRTVSAQVRTIDIAPTILACLHLPPWEQAQGISLVGLCTGQQQDPKLAAYGETFQAQIEYGLSQLRSLTVGGWKYVWTTKPELYCLPRDPDETHNLVEQEPQRAADMLKQLRQLIADAPPPPAKEDSTATLTADDRTQLDSLGYVSGPGVQEEGATELDRFEPRGANAHDYARSFKLISWELPQLLRKKDYRQAEQMLRQLIATMPEAAYLPANLAEVLDAQGRSDEADQTFEHAITLAPKDYVLRMKYGMFLRRMNRPADAEAQFTIALESVPDDTNALSQLGLSLATLGQFDAAEEKLRRALEIDPRNTATLRVMGLICEQAGKLADAVRYFDQALTIDPAFHDCLADRQRVGQRLGW